MEFSKLKSVQYTRSWNWRLKHRDPVGRHTARYHYTLEETADLRTTKNKQMNDITHTTILAQAQVPHRCLRGEKRALEGFKTASEGGLVLADQTIHEVLACDDHVHHDVGDNFVEN